MSQTVSESTRKFVRHARLYLNAVPRAEEELALKSIAGWFVEPDSSYPNLDAERGYVLQAIPGLRRYLSTPK